MLLNRLMIFLTTVAEHVTRIINLSIISDIVPDDPVCSTAAFYQIYRLQRQVLNAVWRP